MKKNIWLNAGLLFSLFVFSVSAVAGFVGPALQLESGAGNTGSAIPVVITIDYVGGSDVVGLQAEFTFDHTNLTVNIASCGGFLSGAVYTCSNPSNGVVRIVGVQLFPIASGGLGSLSFDISAAAANDYTIAVTNEKYGQADQTEIPPGDTIDGSITVSLGPQPAWGDSLIGPEPDELSGQISTTIETIVVIDNGNGDPDSMLDYECTETADPDEKFSQTGDLTGLLAVGETGQMTIACDSSEEGSYTGEVQCTHNGDGDGSDSPVIGPLACTVTPGPEPAYTGVVSGLVMSAVEQGDADPAGSVTVSNSGDDGTTLTGECTISMGDSEISISNGAFGLMPSDGEQVVAVSCDASAEGDFSATVSCAHNGTNTASPAEYDATCEVGPPGPAVYASSPVGAGGIIDLTPGDDAVVGDSSPEATLTITNDAAEANDADLGLTCSLMTANQISASSPAATVAAQDSTQVTFSCNTDNPGSFSDTYTCGYTGTESDGDAVYTVNCGVRDAESDISESPSSGTPLSISVPLGGTGQTSVLFTEILVEGESGTLHGCWFDDGQYFSVLTSIADETVDSGESVEVVVQGTDPGTGVAQISDTLNCNYSDSDNEQTEVSWPVTLNILPAAIPTLSTWGLLALILTMMGLGGIIIRRKVVS